MKQLFRILFAGLVLSGAQVLADVDDDAGLNDWNEFVTNKENTGKPFKLQLTYDVTGRAKFKKDKYDDQRIRYSQWLGEISMVYYYNPQYQEGLNAGISYNDTHLNWDHNPYFRQSNFETLGISLGAFTKRLCKWTWIGQISWNLDMVHCNPALYSTYDLLAWGQYAYCPNFGLDIGLLVMTGMKIDHVYPVIGFDWQINRKLKLNAVFPIDVSLEYTLDKSWMVALAARFIDVRHRVGKHNPDSRGLIEYRAAGVEAAVNYNYCSWITANFHIGSILGGVVRHANRHYRHIHRQVFKSTGYLGGEIDLHF